jgi:hypothetical protein
MYPTRIGDAPSLDDPTSFSLDIQEGAIGTSLTDLSKALNEGALAASALRNISLKAAGNQLQIAGLLHKFVRLPVRVLADVMPSPDGRCIRLHITKIDVLSIPVKSMLRVFRINAGDMINTKGSSSIKVVGEDLELNASELVPPPRNTGKLTDVHIAKSGDLVEVYGGPRHEIEHFGEWRNYIRLRGGTVSLGKLTMRYTDILVVDKSQADWFVFDLARYPEQLVNGETRITPQAGLQILVPDLTKIPQTAENRQIVVEWKKNRRESPPPDLPH